MAGAWSLWPSSSLISPADLGDDLEGVNINGLIDLNRCHGLMGFDQGLMPAPTRSTEGCRPRMMRSGYCPLWMNVAVKSTTSVSR
jgi:hypothetical protein